MIFMRNPNWPAIRHQYCAGYIAENGAHKFWTLEELAQQHGLAHSTLLGRSSEEKWAAQREAMQARIYEQAFLQYESEMAAYLAETDRLAASISTAMLRHIERRFAQAENDKERDALVVKYGDLAGKLARNVHDAYGVDIQVAELQEMRESDEHNQAA